jgi:hypothetical protein
MISNRTPWVFALLVSFAAAAHGTEVLYSDDFATPKAMADSYDHSPFCSGYGCQGLRFGKCELFISSGEALTFLDGSTPSAPLYVRYHFTLDEPLAAVAQASVMTKICGPEAGDPHLIVSISGGVLDESEPDSLRSIGSHTTTRQLGSGLLDIYVSIKGYCLDLDEWSLSLDRDTPVESQTWGRLKHIQR